MDGFEKVARLCEIPPGRMLAVRVGGEDVVLYNVNGAIHATRDRCTHQQFPLSKGALRGKYIRCALHGWEYDVTTGEYTGNPGIRVRCFEVEVRGDEVWVRGA
jgi:nitrite reductase/ring-hydroxylating ferredoxin subunit